MALDIYYIHNFLSDYCSCWTRNIISPISSIKITCPHDQKLHILAARWRIETIAIVSSKSCCNVACILPCIAEWVMEIKSTNKCYIYYAKQNLQGILALCEFHYCGFFKTFKKYLADAFFGLSISLLRFLCYVQNIEKKLQQ